MAIPIDGGKELLIQPRPQISSMENSFAGLRRLHGLRETAKFTTERIGSYGFDGSPARLCRELPQTTTL
jgi:hypothetical protein